MDKIAKKLQGEKRNTYTYRVVGKGPFPIDMLRYDSAWPGDNSAVSGISATRETEGEDYVGTVRSVNLLSVREPTVERWASFGWSVMPPR